MKINTKEKGITLIALIVTIIVLLILAGVTIISLTGENGILGKSSDAKLKREIAKEIEQIKLSVNAVYTNYYNKGYLPVEPLRKELQSSYEGVTSVEETSDIGEATKVSKAKKKVDLGSMFGTESIAAENEDAEPTQEFAKVTYTSKREYYVKIKNITGGNSDPVGTIYTKGGTADDDNVSSNAITYNLNGGTNPEDAPTSYKTGEVIGFPTPTKDGNAFEGWYQTSDFSDERVLRTNDTMSGNITLYAKWAEETNSDYFTWSDGDTTSILTGFSEEGLAVYNAGNLTKLVIPKKHNNLDVTVIKEYAFSGKDKLIEVTIQDMVTRLGDKVFESCTGIEKLTVPISLDVSNKFRYCTNIKKINFTKGTGEGVEYGTSGRRFYTPWYYSKENELEITMEEGITSIGRYMLDGITGLKKLDLPSTLTRVEERAFDRCSNWNTQIDTSRLVNIGVGAFNGCSNITGEIKLSDGLLELGNNAFNGCSNLTGEVKIPSNITSVKGCTFSNCVGIKKVTIPDTVTSMEDKAFDNCTGIEELTVPISLYISNKFGSCTNIKKIDFTKGKGEGVDYGISGRRFYTPWYYSKENELEITMEEGITSIGRYMLDGITGLKKLDLPSTLTRVEERAFDRCSNWNTQIDTSRLVNIGVGAFNGCSNITGEIKLSDGLLELGNNAFNGCSNLTGEVKIPSNITSVKGCTFSNCVGIKKVTIPDTVTSMEDKAFDNCTGIEELTVPISLYVSNKFGYCTNIKKINFTKGTGEGVEYGTSGRYYYTPWYYSRNNELEVTMEEGITSIGRYMFCSVIGLRKLNLPSTLTSIEEKAFNGCSANLLYVFYNGSSSQWENISFGDDNRKYLSNVLYNQN